jgi:hypothetical protein
MGKLANLKPNTVQVLLEQYLHVWIGLRKTGKTTLFRDLVLEKYNGDTTKGILIPFEKGYQALDGIVTAPDFEEWSEYEEIVDEFVSDRNELPYRLIGLDTIDEMVNMAEREAIRFYNSRTTEVSKRAKTINEAGGGYGRGKAYAKQLIRDSLNKLLKAGYGLVLIGHSKEKTIKEKDGTEYMQLSCSLTNDYADIFMDMADIITFFTIEKEIEGNVITSKKIFMNYRSDGFIDCGGRFKGLPDKVEYGAKNYIRVFENAVKASMLKPVDNIEKIAEEQKEKFEETANKNIEKMTSLKDTIKAIKTAMKSGLKQGILTNNSILEILAKYELTTPDDIESTETAKKILDDFTKLVNAD